MKITHKYINIIETKDRESLIKIDDVSTIRKDILYENSDNNDRCSITFVLNNRERITIYNSKNIIDETYKRLIELFLEKEKTF